MYCRPHVTVLLLCCQVDTVVRLCEEALAADMCPVVGIQSTGEARTAEYVAALTAKASDKDRDDMAFDSFVEPAALILSSFIEKNLMNYRGGMIRFFLLACLFSRGCRQLPCMIV
jgi:hypothetical protein